MIDLKHWMGVVVLCLGFWTVGCKSGGGSDGPSVAAPATLTYSLNPAEYLKGQAIAPNTPASTGGAITGFSVSPALPSGLTLNATTGIITGTPLGVSASANYQIIGSNAGGSATCTLSISVVAPPLAEISKLEGDNQQALPGATLPTAPTVKVLDTLKQGVEGVTVTFTPDADSGRVQVATVKTDAEGLASCGSWTLGPNVGLQNLTVKVDGISEAVFTARAQQMSEHVKVSVLAPAAGTIVNDPMTVAASVTSTYQLQAVLASIEGVHQQLTLGTYGKYSTPAWTGSVAFGNKPKGPFGLVISAMDIYGNRTDVVVPLMLDRLPSLSVITPLSESVARPMMGLKAVCTDDDPAGPVSLKADIAGQVIAQGVNEIDQEVDLSAYLGKSIQIVFTATDNAQQTRRETRTVHVEASPNLKHLAEVNGPIWDVAGTRILYLDETQAPPGLKILDTATNQVESLESSEGLKAGYGFLYAKGALYVRKNVPYVSPYHLLFEWREGTLKEVCGLNSGSSLKVSGRWAEYSASDPVTNLYNLMGRDLENGTSTLIASKAGNWANDVAENGDIVYWTADNKTLGYNIYRWRGGVATALTQDAYDTTWNTYPLTDGISVIYRKHTGNTSTRTYQIALHDGATETLLTEPATTEPSTGRHYAICNGHVAYAAEDLAKALQVWRISGGVKTQITFFGTSSTVDALSPDGTLLLMQGGKRYRAPFASTRLEEINSGLGKIILREGRFLLLLGRSVFEVI